MRKQDGFTLVELIVSLSILAGLATMASVAGVGFLSSARVSRASSELVDKISWSREKAVATYQRWRIRFEPSGGLGSSAITSYLIESCSNPQGSTGCQGAWKQEGEAISLTNGVGLEIAPSQGMEIVFNRNGIFAYDASASYDIRVCSTRRKSGGQYECRSGPERQVKVMKFSGAVKS